MSASITRQTYDQIAPDFAAHNAAMPENLARAAERFVELLGKGTRVLDVGCGHGRDSVWLASRAITPIGVDLSSGMLWQARANGVRDLAQMDMLSLGLRDQSFDGVWCCASLLFLPKQLAPVALAEFHRLLTHNGVLFIAVQEGAGEGLEVSSFSAYLRVFIARYQMDQVEQMLEQNGFRIIERARYPDSKTWLHFFATRK